MRLALDTCVLSILCDDRHKEHGDALKWLQKRSSETGMEICVPALAVYELARGLLYAQVRDRKARSRGMERLERLRATFSVLTLDNAALLRAASLWAEARNQGRRTAPDQALDGDVIIAAQALEVGATVVSDNRKHLSRYCAVEDWRMTG